MLAKVFLTQGFPADLAVIRCKSKRRMLTLKWVSDRCGIEGYRFLARQATQVRTILQPGQLTNEAPNLRDLAEGCKAEARPGRRERLAIQLCNGSCTGITSLLPPDT